MKLLSPREDFSRRTLVHLQGELAKLQYAAGLLDSSGRYCHWGLARSYGEETVHQLGRSVHEDAFEHLLGTPLENLHRELNERLGTMPSESIESERILVPQRASEASRLHFSSVLYALRALAEADRSPSPDLQDA